MPRQPVRKPFATFRDITLASNWLIKRLPQVEDRYFVHRETEHMVKKGLCPFLHLSIANRGGHHDYDLKASGGYWRPPTLKRRAAALQNVKTGSPLEILENIKAGRVFATGS